jgi:glyoxalase family protein
MSSTVHGLHHVTAIAGDPQENLDFYTGVLGLRLVKRSVNQDVPDTYHLFYADAAGTPGTDLTFFPWPAMGPGRAGTAMAMEVAFAIPRDSLSYWQDRLGAFGLSTAPVETRFGETTLPFRDPHGLHLALVVTEEARATVPWANSPVPVVHQIRGFHAVRLWVRWLAATTALLTTVMGFRLLATEAGWHRLGIEDGGSGCLVDVCELPSERPGAWGVGMIHHVAWRVRDEQEALALRHRLMAAGLQPTPLIDRFWFRSVYFREPGGVLFELATDGPGFAVDEDPAHLGEQLILPPWLEPHRQALTAVLPPLTLSLTQAP